MDLAEAKDKLRRKEAQCPDKGQGPTEALDLANKAAKRAASLHSAAEKAAEVAAATATRLAKEDAEKAAEACKLAQEKAKATSGNVQKCEAKETECKESSSCGQAKHLQNTAQLINSTCQALAKMTELITNGGGGGDDSGAQPLGLSPCSTPPKPSPCSTPPKPGPFSSMRDPLQKITQDMMKASEELAQSCVKEGSSSGSSSSGSSSGSSASSSSGSSSGSSSSAGPVTSPEHIYRPAIEARLAAVEAKASGSSNAPGSSSGGRSGNDSGSGSGGGSGRGSGGGSGGGSGTGSGNGRGGASESPLQNILSTTTRPALTETDSADDDNSDNGCPSCGNSSGGSSSGGSGNSAKGEPWPPKMDSLVAVTQAFRVDNTLLSSPTSRALAFRRSKTMDDKSDSGAEWGSVVSGTIDGDGWLLVNGEGYLPFFVGGQPVLASVMAGPEPQQQQQQLQQQQQQQQKELDG